MKNGGKSAPWSDEVRSGDLEARSRFVESHLDVVRYLALRIASRLPSSVEVDDLVHDGIVGLLDAVDKYDPRRGVRFRTYAEARVKGAILDGLRHKDWCPRSVRRNRRELDEAIGRLSTVRGRAATEEEIAEEMGLDLESYRGVLRDLQSGPLLSLEDLPAASDPAVTADALLPHRRLERREMIEALAEELTRLPERERRALELYYHEGLNLKEVGAVLGVTESRVCQLHAQAAARLRVSLGRRLHAGPETAEEELAVAASRRSG